MDWTFDKHLPGRKRLKSLNPMSVKGPYVAGLENSFSQNAGVSCDQEKFGPNIGIEVLFGA
jgi:hypothetical protein